jgi:hypothetical protein
MKPDLILMILVSESSASQTDTMCSRPPSELYSDGWDRTFGQDPEELEWELPMPSKDQLN